MDHTDQYCEQFAAEFFGSTVGVDMKTIRQRFFAQLAPRAHILDAGCGSGRDAKAFAEAGFQVTAFDASAELARLASAHCGFEVAVRRFEDVHEVEAFDGTWCCASLLHVPLAAMPAALDRLWRALRPGGTLYVSFKHGTGERVHGGRRFTDADEATLRQWFDRWPDVNRLDVWLTDDQRPDRTERWTNALATRKPVPSQRLVTGGADHFLPHLSEPFTWATQADLAVAFVKTTGLRLLLPDLESMAALAGSRRTRSASRDFRVDSPMNARLTSLLQGLLLAALVCLNANCARLAIPADDAPLRAADGNFPGAAWRTSPPEAQGIDSETLVALMDAVQANHLPIHSLQIVRYGQLVLDAYFHPFLPGERHDVASVTKSVTTTLVGLALERGALAGLGAPVYPLLSPAPPADDRKQQIRLRHLLTTSSGLDCGLAPYERETLAMAASADWVRFALDIPMREAPGMRFAYCSPGFHLLSALITRGTGLAAEEFAREALFAPIGIADVRWPRDPQGISHGGGDLQLQPTDLLRLGYLFLRQGEWSGRQVIPREWIAQATRHQVDATGSQGYGFGWWVSTDIPGMYQASGRGGQRLIVWPAKDIVVVVTAGGFDPARIAPFLLRSLKSNAALPRNPEGHERLLARVRAAAQPRSTGGTTPPLPPRAAMVDGIDYDLDPNPLGVRAVQLRFPSQAPAQARFRLREGELVVPLGLDGAYRIGIDAATASRVAGRGRWTGPDQLVLEIDTIAGINHFTVTLNFEGDRLEGLISERAGLIGEMAVRGQGQR